jgi:cellulose synthase/poly-beta-1,6-N-acetylglucosamine synthase-like glycosyltransferase
VEVPDPHRGSLNAESRPVNAARPTRYRSGVPSVAVVVPTYRRPEALARCLDGVQAQTDPPDDVVAVCRQDDAPTLAVVAAHPGRARVVGVEVAGQYAALGAGVAAVQTDVVAFTDDDAVPHDDWVARIRQHFAADPGLGGLGGRDVVAGDDRVPATGPVVGQVQATGRVVGNHHLGRGPIRPVDVLKGANMAFRREALADAFDAPLVGDGAQVHNDLTISLAVAAAGWELRYDPAVLVDHHPADRASGVAREPTPEQAYESARNQTAAFRRYAPRRRLVSSAVWGWTVGTRTAPGLVHAARGVARRDGDVARRWWAATRGRFDAFRDPARSGP